MSERGIFRVFKSPSDRDITGFAPWVFGLKRVWVTMGYQGIMGYGVDFPLSRLGKAIILWVIRVYGLPEVWVKRVSPVSQPHNVAFMLHELCETSVNLALLSLISEMVPQSYPQLSDQTADTAPITSVARGFPPTSYDTYCESTPEDITLIEQVRRHPCRLGAERHVVSSSLRSLEPLNTPSRLEARRRADRLSTGAASSFADVHIPP